MFLQTMEEKEQEDYEFDSDTPLMEENIYEEVEKSGNSLFSGDNISDDFISFEDLSNENNTGARVTGVRL